MLVSLGSKGALLIGENGTIYRQASPPGRLVNSVGAGDSMVAGFIAGYLHNGNVEEALRLGVCTGSASAFKNWLATKHDVSQVLLTL